MKKKLLTLFLTFTFLIISLVGCSSIPKEDIYILFTNDVHAAFIDNIGYVKVKNYKEQLINEGKTVYLVDCGDHSQGDYMSAISKGECGIEIMNTVGYDLATLGNHEFDFGLAGLKNIIDKATYDYVCCNIKYIGQKENVIEDVQKFKIVKFNNTKVAFVGVTTPTIISKSIPAYLKEDGQLAIDFAQKDAETFYNTVQESINQAKKKGANYVILLAHLGTDEVDEPFNSYNLISNINGVDVVLDAHSHSEIEKEIVKDVNGKEVLLSSTGTKLNNIGQLVLTKENTIELGYVDTEIIDNEANNTLINNILDKYNTGLDQVIGSIDFDFSIYNSDNIRIVRDTETGIGDFVADSMRLLSLADIAFINGGGIKGNIKEGDVTYGDIYNITPNGNNICIIQLTGQQILDMFEYFYSKVTNQAVKDGKPATDFSSFASISGLQVVIDSSIKTSVITGDDGFIKVDNTRRITQMNVLKDGQYQPIDPNQNYTVATIDYIALKGGSGMSTFLKDVKVLNSNIGADYQFVVNYFNQLNGDLSQYKTVDNRIIVE